MATLTTSVLIVGAGPVGLILAHYLGQSNVPVLQIDAAAELSDEPRAVGLDPESLRSFQSLQLLEDLRPDILFGVTGDYLNGAGEVMFAIENDEPGALGYPNLSGFNQPALVRTLARELERYRDVSLRFQHRLLDFEQSEDGVIARVEDSAGDVLEVRADYLVACDGGRSAVRAQLGIKMQGESNPLPWLVIDTREKHYDGKRKVRFYCNPERPGMFLQTPHSNRRWEWMLMPGEDREAFLQDDVIHQLISPYVDVTDIDIYRRRVYDFHAIIADRFQEGRVFLAGDAAHMTPPFAGQGLNSGIRDAANLGWKLAAVINQGAPASLLDSYEKERWKHAKELIDMALMLGAQIQPTDPELAAARDAAFKELHSQPPEAMDGFVRGIFKALEERYFDEGAAVNIEQDWLSGRMLTQPGVVAEDGVSGLLDDHLGAGFTILGYNCDPAQELAEELLAPWLASGAKVLSLGTEAGGLELAAYGKVVDQLFAQGSCNMVLVRPDRFCMAAFTADDAADKLSRAASLMGIKS